MKVMLFISLALNIFLCIDAWWLATECRKAEDKNKELLKCLEPLTAEQVDVIIKASKNREVSE